MYDYSTRLSGVYTPGHVHVSHFSVRASFIVRLHIVFRSFKSTINARKKHSFIFVLLLFPWFSCYFYIFCYHSYDFINFIFYFFCLHYMSILLFLHDISRYERSFIVRLNARWERSFIVRLNVREERLFKRTIEAFVYRAFGYCACGKPKRLKECNNNGKLLSVFCFKNLFSCIRASINTFLHMEFPKLSHQ